MKNKKKRLKISKNRPQKKLQEEAYSMISYYKNDPEALELMEKTEDVCEYDFKKKCICKKQEK